MRGSDRPPELKDLDARLKQARGEERSPAPQPATRGVAEGLRLSLELAAAVAVGVGIGWFLDRWLGSSPLFLLVFLALGLAAGLRNVYQAADRLSAKNTAREEPAGQDGDEARSRPRVETGERRRGRGKA